MDRNQTARAHQQRRIQRRAAHTDSDAFFNVLTGPELFDEVESLLPDHRERLFSPTETLSMFLSQALSADRSCQRAVNDAAIGRYQGKGGDEQTLLRSILETLKAGDILLGDAYYATYFLLCALQARGVDAVFEQRGARQRRTDFRRGQRLGARDHLITLAKPSSKPDWMAQADYDHAPDKLTVRELHAGGKILVTTLLNPNHTPKTDVKRLYRSHWHIELDLRHIKTPLGLDMLSCKTPAMVEKEIWIYLLAYNLIRLLMAQSALLTDKLPRELSFKHTLQLWLAWHQCGIDNDDKLTDLFVLIAQQRVGNRPGRIEPRAVKRRPKSYPLLIKPRMMAREDVRRNGHPK